MTSEEGERTYFLRRGEVKRHSFSGRAEGFYCRRRTAVPTDRPLPPSTWNDVVKEGAEGLLEFGGEAAVFQAFPSKQRGPRRERGRRGGVKPSHQVSRTARSTAEHGEGAVKGYGAGGVQYYHAFVVAVTAAIAATRCVKPSPRHKLQYL